MGVDSIDLVTVAEWCETYVFITGEDFALSERLTTSFRIIFFYIRDLISYLTDQLIS